MLAVLKGPTHNSLYTNLSSSRGLMTTSIECGILTAPYVLESISMAVSPFLIFTSR